MSEPEDPLPLFRPEAMRHWLEAEEGRGLVRVSPPWTWALLAALLSALGAALGLAWFGRVEVNGRARGILRPATGVRTVTSQLDGTVGRVEVASGQRVRAGAVLVRIEAPPVRAQLLEAARMADTVRRDFRITAGLQGRAQAAQLRRLDGRMAKLGEQAASERESLERLERTLRRSLALEREGVLSPAAVDAAREDRARAQRQLMLSEQGLEQAAQERAGLESRHQEELWQRRQALRNAETRAEALALLQGQAVLSAPEDGTVEALLVKPCDAVRAGQALCKIIPGAAHLQGVVFLEEKDRAFVRPGDEVRLELDQLPCAEFGTVGARVERISEDLAGPFEVQEAMGALGPAPVPAGPAFRVELGLLSAKVPDQAGIPLRSGMLLNARFTLRRQRLITLVLEPLRRWLR